MRGPACLPRNVSLVAARGARRENGKAVWSISRRPVSSYFEKIVNAFSGNRQTRNPFLENHRYLFPVVGDGSGGSSSGDGGGGANDPTRETDKYTPSSLARNLDFSFVSSPNRIRFLKDADRAIRATRTDQMRELLRRVEEGGTKGGDPATVSSHDRLLEILQQWNLVEAPGAALHSVAAWMHLLDITGVAAALDGEEGEDTEDEEAVRMTDKLLETIQQNYAIDNAPEQSPRDEIERALFCLVRQHRNQTGFGLHPDDRRGKYRDLLKQQRALERQLGEMVEAYQEGGSTSPDMKRMVSTMYGFLHLKRQQAELLGYDSLVSHVFDKDGGGMAAASLGQVRALHGAVSGRLEPHLRQLAQRHEISSAATSGYLSPSGNGNPGLSGRPPSQQSETGRPVRPMRWEKHVTLDGALQFAAKIALDLFGLSIVEEQQASDFKDRVWDASVRLFHVHHSATSQYLGSFYLDALARPAKAPRSFATVLYAPAAPSPSALDLSTPLTPSTSPIVVGMSLNIEPTAWDTDPVRLRWDDILSLLHEFGHVLDIFLLLNSSKERMSLGTIAGHASLPFHRSEVLPKVRC
jgi:Peptidase family M3